MTWSLIVSTGISGPSGMTWCTSGYRRLRMRRHAEHSPQPTFGCSGQFRAAAMAIAAGRFPDPAGPASNHAWGTSPEAIWRASDSAALDPRRDCHTLIGATAPVAAAFGRP